MFKSKHSEPPIGSFESSVKHENVLMSQHRVHEGGGSGAESSVASFEMEAKCFEHACITQKST